VCRSPVWAAAEPGTPEALEAMADRLRRAGAEISAVELPASFDGLDAAHRTIMHGEGRAAFLNLARTHRHLLHDDFIGRAENRDGITGAQMAGAYDLAARCRAEFDALAGEYDAVLTPSAKGEAPVGRHPGEAVFNRMWTLLHVPCVNIPGHRGPNGLPVGVTLTAPRFCDRALLAIAAAV
jgi:Asp-tRNA(Asn)/Glu-tRNA(Gln) amidotransferase A subunit family amidase